MKKLLIPIALAISASVLSGCETPKSEVYFKEFVVMEIDPPKHFNLTLRDDDGNLYNAYSKHCSNYKVVELGDKYRLPLTISTYSNGKVYKSLPSACKIVEEYVPINRF